MLAIEISAGASASAASPIPQCPDPFRDYVSVLWTLSSNATTTESLLVTLLDAPKQPTPRKTEREYHASSRHILSVAKLPDMTW